MDNIKLYEKNSLVLNPIKNDQKILIVKDEPLSVLIKDSSGKIEPFYLAYNVYSLNGSKYTVSFSKSLKFRKEIYYQVFHQVIVDIYSKVKDNQNGDLLFLNDISLIFKNSNYNTFKLVPLSEAKNKDYCLNSRIIKAKIGAYNYFACNFIQCTKNPKRRTSFLLWRELA